MRSGTRLEGATACTWEFDLYLFDGHGDVTGLADKNGDLQKSYEYDAFGNETDIDSSDTNPFRYCGEYYDNETGNLYLRARYYDMSTGRFISEDPIKDGSNWYAYCYNNAVNYVDITGMAPFSERMEAYKNKINESKNNFENMTNETNGQNIRDLIKNLPNDIQKYNINLKDLFGYDPYQGVFYFKNSAPQRQFGYTDIYDYGAVIFSMNIDWRIFEFEYNSRHWRLELWKGNYNSFVGLAGGEVGLYYNTDGSSYYSCALPEDYLNIKLVVKSKNGQSFVCDTRYTWWQTGFQLGNTSLPEELKLYVEVQFKDKGMTDAFRERFENMPEYMKKGVSICDNSQANTINITWDYGI